MLGCCGLAVLLLMLPARIASHYNHIMETPQPTPLLRRAGFSFLLGFGIFLSGALLQIMFRRMGVSGIWELVDNVVSGIVTGFVVFLYEKQRHNDVVRNLRMITAMNHHVRNALQSILYVPYSPTQADQVKVIQSSVERIQWALREILPGEIKEDQAFSQGPSTIINKSI